MGGIRLWTLLVSAAAHAVLLLFLLDWQENQGAAAVGLGGLEVALGPAGGATTSPDVPDAPPVDAVGPPAMAETVESVEEASPEPVQSARPVEVVPTPAPMAAAEPPPVNEPDRPPPITSSAIDPVETIASAAPEVDEQPVAEPRPVFPELARAEPAQTETVQAREPVATPPPPPRKPRRHPPTRPAQALAATAPAPQPAVEPAAAAPAPAASADPGPSASTRGTPGAAEGADVDSDPGGGLPGPTPDYLGLLRAWLEKHKEYPRPSRTRREEGTVLLRFVIERSGHVVSHRIERSSGYPALDRAVEEMLARAQPLPAMPAEMTRARLELVVPVQFALRGR